MVTEDAGAGAGSAGRESVFEIHLRLQGGFRGFEQAVFLSVRESLVDESLADARSLAGFSATLSESISTYQ